MTQVRACRSIKQMLYKLKVILLLRMSLPMALVCAMIAGCSPEHYKAEADEEVYKIIDDKWQGHFGEKANYVISDMPSQPNDIQVERTVPEPSVVSLADAVSIATGHNRQYQTEKELLYLTALDLTLERHQFARQWFGTVDAEYVRDRDEASADFGESVGADAELGFDQLLADGAVVSANIAIDWMRFLTGAPDTSLGSVLSASITQPLLRGRGRRIVQEQLTQAERDALYQIRSFNRFRKEFVVEIVSDYYRVLQSKDRVKNAKNDYSSRLESKQRLEMLAEAGRMPRFEVDQAEQDVLRAWDNYVRSQQEYEQQLDLFKLKLAFSTDAKIQLDQNELTSLQNIGVEEPEYDVREAIETGILERLDLANSADRIDDSVRKVVVAADGLGADLDLFAGLEADSREKTDFDKLQFHKGTYTLGLSADLPLDRKAERNIYRQALIALEQQQRKYQEDVDLVKLDVRQSYRDLQEAAEVYGIRKNSLRLAEKRVESTSLLLEAGRANTRDLLESQNALLSAQNGVTAALIDHAIAKLSFFRDVGVLQVKPDGMWQ